MIARVISRKAGPTGSEAKGMAKAWAALQQAAEQKGRTSCLPASAAFVASVIRQERMRAEAAARGSRGGATCAASLRKGLREGFSKSHAFLLAAWLFSINCWKYFEGRRFEQIHRGIDPDEI